MLCRIEKRNDPTPPAPQAMSILQECEPFLRGECLSCETTPSPPGSPLPRNHAHATGSSDAAASAPAPGLAILADAAAEDAAAGRPGTADEIGVPPPPPAAAADYGGGYDDVEMLEFEELRRPEAAWDDNGFGAIGELAPPPPGGSREEEEEGGIAGF